MTICIFLEWYRLISIVIRAILTLAYGRYIKHWALKRWGKWFPSRTIHLTNCVPAVDMDQEVPTCADVRKALWTQYHACNFLLFQLHRFFSSPELYSQLSFLFFSTFFSEIVSYACNIITLFKHTLDFTLGSSHLVNTFSYVLYCDIYTLP